jgi:hypothetical protein
VYGLLSCYLAGSKWRIAGSFGSKKPGALVVL